MTNGYRGRVAIVYPGDYEVRQNATPENNRLSGVFHALADLRLHAEPAVYHDAFCEVVRRQLMQVDAVLVWVNPIQDGCDRSILDPMLRQVADAGIYVSTHPDVIVKMGTKEVLYRTRDIGWGCDTHLYRSLEQMRSELPSRLACGEARVLKQYRGNGGNGVWKVALETDGPMVGGLHDSVPIPQSETFVRVRHAKRGSIEEVIALDAFFNRCEIYFRGHGRMIDQAYQMRLPEGMVRCYLVHDKVAGFGHQAVNALYPAPAGTPADEAPQPGPRLYHSPHMPEFQQVKQILEKVWLPAMQRQLTIDSKSLPILWDCDFMLGPKGASGEDTYVLCEINVSSVAPFPESSVPLVAQATLSRIQALKKVP